MNTLLNYPGAKWGMAKTIVDLMPPHRSYLEPFFGSGAVLFNKPPSAIETVNDIDGEIVNFFQVLRQQPEDLAEAVALTPYIPVRKTSSSGGGTANSKERSWASRHCGGRGARQTSKQEIKGFPLQRGAWCQKLKHIWVPGINRAGSMVPETQNQVFRKPPGEGR